MKDTWSTAMLEGAYMVEKVVIDKLQAKGFPIMKSSEITAMLAEVIAEMENNG
jgi:hypothetical protein